MTELHEMDDEQLQELLSRAETHAARKLRGRRWLGLPGGVPPGGRQPMDIVNQAIMKLLQGTRSRNLHKYPRLLDQLLAIIDSEVSSLVRRHENQSTRLEPDDDAPSSWDMERSAVDRETIVAAFELMETYAIDKDDELLLDAIELFKKSGSAKPADLVKDFSLSAQEASNLRRRLQSAIQFAKRELEVTDV